MTATIEILEYNTSSGNESVDITNLNFGNVDSINIVAASHPIIAGQNSFEKWLKMSFASIDNKIDNLKVWKESGVYKTAELVKYNIPTGTAETFATPTETTSIVATTTIPTSVPGTSNISINGTVNDATGLTTTGITKSDYVVLQLQTGSTTEAGDVNQKVIRFQYDEQ